MANFSIKRGQSLALTIAVTNQDGTPTVLTAAGIVMSASFRDAQFNLLATVAPVASTSVAGQASIFIADTSAWPQGLVRMDMLVSGLIGPGGVQANAISPTYGIEVGRPVSEISPEQPQFNPVTA
jgi:hypothetical protein